MANAVKNYDGLAIASIKNIDALAAASITNVNGVTFTATTPALTSSDFTTSNADGGTVTWSTTQATLTYPNNGKTVFAKNNLTKNSNIIYCQANLNLGTQPFAGSLSGIMLSSTDLVTSSPSYTQNYTASIVGRSTTNQYRARVYTTSVVYDLDGTGITQVKDVKITFDTSNNNIKFWYWSGSAWTQMGTTQTYDIIQGGTIKFYLVYPGLGSNTGNYIFDNIYFGSAASDYTTQYP